MQLSSIKSLQDLVLYFSERDSNHDIKLEPAEMSGDERDLISSYDRSSDGKLSPWEVMLAVNGNNADAPAIFGQKEIEDVRGFNKRIGIFGEMAVSGASIYKKGTPQCKPSDFGDVDYLGYDKDKYVCSSSEDCYYLYIDHAIREGIKFGKGTCISTFGGIRRGVLTENVVIDGCTYSKGSIIDLYGSATSLDVNRFKWVPRGTLAEDVTIDGCTYAKGTVIERYENGVVKSGYLVKDILINGVKYAKGTVLERYEDGLIKHGYLAENTVIDGFVFPKGSDISYYDGGRGIGGVKEGLLAETNYVGWSKYKAGRFQNSPDDLLVGGFSKMKPIDFGLLLGGASMSGNTYRNYPEEFQEVLRFADEHQPSSVGKRDHSTVKASQGSILLGARLWLFDVLGVGVDEVFNQSNFGDCGGGFDYGQWAWCLNTRLDGTQTFLPIEIKTPPIHIVEGFPLFFEPHLGFAYPIIKDDGLKKVTVSGRQSAWGRDTYLDLVDKDFGEYQFFRGNKYSIGFAIIFWKILLNYNYSYWDTTIKFSGTKNPMEVDTSPHTVDASVGFRWFAYP